MSFLGISFKVREAGALRRRAEHSSSVAAERNAPKTHLEATKSTTTTTTTLSTTTTKGHQKPTPLVSLPTNGRINGISRAGINILAVPGENDETEKPGDKPDESGEKPSEKPSEKPD
ncbi:hypothetical protein BGZ96_003939, partial [Linnemannia gamsii]